MLSQVERGETSPTLTIAGRIAAGLELRLSQLLRLDEGGTVSVVRPADRRSGGADGHRWEVLTPPLPGQRAEVSCHTLQPGARTGGPGDPPMHEPGARETSLVQRGRADLRLRRHPPRARRGRLRDLRRRPSPPLREPRRGGSSPARRRVGGAAPLMSQTLFDRIWDLHEVADGSALHRPAPRPRGHERRRPSTACASPAGPCAAPTARSPPPTTTSRPTARRSRPASATSSRACRSRRSSATARSSGSRSTRWAPTARASST